MGGGADDCYDWRFCIIRFSLADCSHLLTLGFGGNFGRTQGIIVGLVTLGKCLVYSSLLQGIWMILIKTSLVILSFTSW